MVQWEAMMGGADRRVEVVVEVILCMEDAGVGQKRMNLFAEGRSCLK
jgi:hypothetical protein